MEEPYIPRKPEYLFYAEITKGHIPKSTFDALSTLSRVPMCLSSKHGITITMTDNELVSVARVIWDVHWPKNKLGNFECEIEETISFNCKLMYTLLKNVKKKDSLAFFILKADKDRLKIRITSQQKSTEKFSGETTYVPIQYITPVPITLPNVYDEKEVYEHCVIAQPTWFQRVRKLLSLSKNTISVYIQKTNYIAFKIEGNNVHETILEDGQIRYDSEGKIHDLYNKQIHVSFIAPLLKLPNMCTHYEFYAPNHECFPLKVVIPASSGLGDIQYFIKSIDQK